MGNGTTPQLLPPLNFAMKIEFKVTKVWEYTNGQTDERFKKLQLIHTKEIVDQGTKVRVNKCAYLTVQETELTIDSPFVFDSDKMDMSKRSFTTEDGKQGEQFVIYYK